MPNCHHWFDLIRSIRWLIDYSLEAPTCLSVTTWSLSRKCKTRGNLPIGNLWLGGRSHTYLLWWIMGSPLDSDLTCQVRQSEITFNANPCTVQWNILEVHYDSKFSRVHHGNICARRLLHRLLNDIVEEMFVLRRSCAWMALQLDSLTVYVKCYETFHVLSVHGCVAVFALCCHLVSWSEYSIQMILMSQYLYMVN